MKEFLKYFVNKICTITTTQINFRFKEEQMLDYFVGLVEDIDDHGILMIHMKTKCKNYIFFPHIVSISEEQVLYENDPEHAKIIEQYRKEKPITSAKTRFDSPFVDPKEMAAIVKSQK